MKSDISALCLFHLLSAAIFAITFAAGQTTPVESDDQPRVNRLPDHTEPVSYGLHVIPTVDRENNNYTFRGRVDIVIRAKRYTSEVILNSRDLIVTAVSAFRDVKTDRYTPVIDYVYDQRNERLIIRLERSVVPARLYGFTVEFGGVLRNDFTGFHKFFYDSVDDSRWIALTQFKPIYARRAFPCYDEPKFKTPYAISIARQNQHFALSNMPLNHSEIDSQSGWTWDHFETTKPIPTYLVAFMVSDLNRKALKNDNIAMYTRKELIEDTTYMMGKAPNLLEGVEKFTQIPYMLPKLDLVGVPLLDAYNMENWGLNSYQEFYLTLSNNSQTDDKILGTMTVLHEILHQWFGNMVTAARWDYAWLNEGICNYLNYHITNKIETDWKLEGTFLETVHQYALAWDEYNDTHPLTFSVQTPDEIVNSFDPIARDKGAALFRMLRNTVGDVNFETSLNKYLNDFAYTAAGPRELWETFDYVLFNANYVIDQDVMVNNSMYLWTEQAGYPLINVEAREGSIVVTQKRFMLSKSNDTDDVKWFVGLSYTTENEKNFNESTPTVWLKPNEERKVIPLPANSGWIIFNIQSTGFYRVNYDEKNWKLLLIQLITKPDGIHVLNRAQIIDDAHHLSRASIVPYDYYTSLLEYLLMEDHVTPWSTATNGLSSIENGIRRYPAEHSKFREYVKGLANILYGKISRGQINNESTKIGWRKLLTWSCKSGSSHCQISALRHFKAWTNGHGIPSEMKEAAFCIGMKNGNITAWSKMYEFYKATRSSSDKQIALRALACIENFQTLFNYVNLVRLDTTTGNFKTVFENIATSPYGVKALANVLLRESNAILAQSDGHRLASFAYSVLASKVSTDEEILTMNKIRWSTKSADLRAAYDEKHQKIISNLKWMERDHKKIIKALGGVWK